MVLTVRLIQWCASDMLLDSGGESGFVHNIKQQIWQTKRQTSDLCLVMHWKSNLFCIFWEISFNKKQNRMEVFILRPRLRYCLKVWDEPMDCFWIKNRNAKRNANSSKFCTGYKKRGIYRQNENKTFESRITKKSEKIYWEMQHFLCVCFAQIRAKFYRSRLTKSLWIKKDLQFLQLGCVPHKSLRENSLSNCLTQC